MFRDRLDKPQLESVGILATKRTNSSRLASPLVLTSIMSALIAVLLFDGASAATLVDKPWDPTVSPNGWLANQSQFGGPNLTADPFALVNGATVTKVAWWGFGTLGAEGFGFFGTATWDVRFFEMQEGSPPFPAANALYIYDTGLISGALVQFNPGGGAPILQTFRWEVDIPSVFLPSGDYAISLAITDHNGIWNSATEIDDVLWTRFFSEIRG